ncbi:MAG: DNA polymerase sliding clamp [Methanophagales archaeon]|jgi:proliferating cell nuclear antigen|nr:proliferating cell antigen [Methanophagales archaeon]MCK4736440.1 DNA polymerase sliding clamp [Methanophagales archaeon]
MFEAKIDASMLRACVETITAIVDEGKLRITAEGLKLRAVDPANVAMISFVLQRDAFDDFQFSVESEGDTEIEIGMDFMKLIGILGIGGREDVELKLDENAQKLYTRMGSLDYTLSLLDPSSLRKEPKVPELEFPAKVIIETEEFRRTIRAAEKIGENIVLGVDGEEFYMEAEGEMDKLRLGLGKEQLIDLTPETVSSLYSLEYISSMSKGISHAENITLNLGKNYPLQMDFALAEGKVKVSYLLAPRIESE